MGNQANLAPLTPSPSLTLLEANQRLHKLRRKHQQRKRRGRGQRLPVKPKRGNGRFEGVAK